MPARGTARSIKKSELSEAEAKLQEHGYKAEDERPKRERGVPEGYRRFTCVLDVADNQLLHDWASTVPGETFTTVMATALREYIEAHVRAAAAAGLKVRRPNDSEEFRAALGKYEDLYEGAEITDPYKKFI